MISLRLVLDTNVVVSAVLKPESVPRTVLLLAMTKPVKWYVSDEIMEEYSSVLARPELKIRKGLQHQFLQLITNRAKTVAPAPLPPLTPDPADNIFLECADVARADYLITGNRRHFPRFWKNTKVVTPQDFLTIVAPHLG